MADFVDEDDNQEIFGQEVTFLDTGLELDAETTCTICYAEFLDPDDLSLHIQQVHSAPQNLKIAAVATKPQTSKPCQFCHSTYTDLDEYARHIAHKHYKDLICCEYCHKCFTSQKEANEHGTKHKTVWSALQCSQCKAMFATAKELEAHEFTLHDNVINGQFLPCMPHLSNYLKFNAESFLLSKPRTLECCACHKVVPLAKMQDYLKHVTVNKCKAYTCDMCYFTSNSHSNVAKHLKCKYKCQYLRDIAQDTTQCLNCKKRFNCKALFDHLISEGCSNISCITCRISFDSLEKMSSHQSECHQLELNIKKCKFCSKEFVGVAALNKHIKRAHSRQILLYKYACKSCNGIFKHPQELFAHYFRMHKTLLPYTCNICDQKFRIRKRFTLHIKLEHKSNGFVEFDENYLVFFTKEKSQNPFIPKCVVPEFLHIVSSEQEKDGKTDAETEIEEKGSKISTKPTVVTKIRKRKITKCIEDSQTSSEESEPLVKIKKRAQRKQFQNRFASSNVKAKSRQRRQLTCKVCKKYCYTFQNYNNHIKIHAKNKSIECIKCSESFKNKKALSEHIKNMHATSQLIETLKNVLERKQSETHKSSNIGTDIENDDDFANLTNTERFLRTIKKVKIDSSVTPAKIATVSGDLSVKNFIENFVPDPNEIHKNIKETEEQQEETVVTIKEYHSPFFRKSVINMIKFVPEEIPQQIKLKMPEKFKEDPIYGQDKVKLNVRLVEKPRSPTFLKYETKFPQNDHNYEAADDHFDDYDDRNESIPEVAQEVMLEGSEENSKFQFELNPDLQGPQKIVIPKLPAGYPKLHIATLQPQAPFFKIITVQNDNNAEEAIVINTPTKENPKKQIEKPTLKKEVISLPDGTKFVTTNPLEHLLDKPVEEILEPLKNKYYKPVNKNIKGLLANALQNIDNKNFRIKPKKKVESAGESKKAGPARRRATKSKPDEISTEGDLPREIEINVALGKETSTEHSLANESIALPHHLSSSKTEPGVVVPGKSLPEL